MCKDKFTDRLGILIILVCLAIITPYIFIANVKAGRPAYQHIVTFGFIFIFSICLLILGIFIITNKEWLLRFLLPMAFGTLIIGTLLAIYLLLNVGYIGVLDWVDFSATSEESYKRDSIVTGPVMVFVIALLAFVIVVQYYLKLRKERRR